MLIRLFFYPSLWDRREGFAACSGGPWWPRQRNTLIGHVGHAIVTRTSLLRLLGLLGLFRHVVWPAFASLLPPRCLSSFHRRSIVGSVDVNVVISRTVAVTMAGKGETSLGNAAAWSFMHFSIFQRDNNFGNYVRRFYLSSPRDDQVYRAYRVARSSITSFPR